MTPQQLFDLEKTARDALHSAAYDPTNDCDMEETIARLFWERHIKVLQREKDARIYYQNIVYAVCNALDKINRKKPGQGVVCGTPTTQVQDQMSNLATILDTLRQEAESL